MNDAFTWLQDAVQPLNEQMRQHASARQQQLTKPAGALGEIDRLAIKLAALQGVECPALDKVQITVFAADHGIAAKGVSAFPQAVTAQMVQNFAHGGAAISVAARQLGAALEVVNLGTVDDLPCGLPCVYDRVLGKGTACFLEQPAMTASQLADAMQQGREAVTRAVAQGCQLFIGGEMGIGNTTSATALVCARLAISPLRVTGPGTGLDRAGLDHKVACIEQGLALHQLPVDKPLQQLQCVGGFEIAALCGAYIAAAQQGIAVLVDGFICSVAALLACSINPAVRSWLLFAHCSAEPGHQVVLDTLQARPLLDLGLRLGEGSGAALALPLLQMACAWHGQMATFAEAGVSDGRA